MADRLIATTALQPRPTSTPASGARRHLGQQRAEEREVEETDDLPVSHGEVYPAHRLHGAPAAGERAGEPARLNDRHASLMSLRFVCLIVQTPDRGRPHRAAVRP